MDRLLYAGVYTGLGPERMGPGVRIEEGTYKWRWDIAWDVDRGYVSTKAGPEEKIGLIMMLQIRLGEGLTMGTGNTGPGLETSLKPGSLFSLQHGIKKRGKKRKGSNTSGNRDYNCRGQLLSRLLQHLVYSTWLAELSGQSLQGEEWKVRFGPQPEDCHFSILSTTIQIRGRDYSYFSSDKPS